MIVVSSTNLVITAHDSVPQSILNSINYRPNSIIMLHTQIIRRNLE